MKCSICENTIEVGDLVIVTDNRTMACNHKRCTFEESMKEILSKHFTPRQIEIMTGALREKAKHGE